MAQRSNRPSPQEPAPDPEAVQRHVDDLRKRLTRAGRKDVAVQIQRQMGNDVPCYGIKPAEVHRIGQEMGRIVRGGALGLSLAIGDEIMKSGNLEEGLVGAQLVGAMARHISGGDFERFDAWARSLNNAQTADALGMSCITHALAAKPSLAAKLNEWAKDASPWRRRAAVMSFVPLVRPGRFTTDALAVAEIVMEDSDEEVQWGVGSLLMEASRLRGARVVEFLMLWKDKSPRLLLQTAAMKLGDDDRQAVLGQ